MSATTATATRLHATPAPPVWQASVPRLCIGRARAFWSDLDASDTEFKAAINAILRPLHHRWNQRRSLRAEHLADCRRQWEQLPPFGRLGLKVEANPAKRQLSIAELRLACGDMKFMRWAGGPNELSIAAELVTLIASKKRFSMHAEVLAIVSFHALARRIQRGADGSHEAIMRDIAALIAAHESILAQPGASRSFTFTLPDGGQWIGAAVEAQFVDRRPARRVLAVRTYWRDA